MELYDSLGILGFLFYIASYALLQTRIIQGDSVSYITLNLLAAILVLISLTNHFNIASALIQISWIAISLYGLFYTYRRNGGFRGILDNNENAKSLALKVLKFNNTPTVYSRRTIGMILTASLAALYASSQALISDRTTVEEITQSDNILSVGSAYPEPHGKTGLSRPINNPETTDTTISTLLTRAQSELESLERSHKTDANPWPLFKRILSLDPENAKARSGQKQLFTAYVKLAKVASANGDQGLSAEFLGKAKQVLFGQPGIFAGYDVEL